MWSSCKICFWQASGRREEVRYLLWIRLSRVRKVIEFFQAVEKDIRINYLFTRIVKLLVVELYCTHTAACIFYYLATTLPPSEEGYTWIGSLKLGDDSYSHFRDIDIWKRYTTSLYFAIVTMATVGKSCFWLQFFVQDLTQASLDALFIWFSLSFTLGGLCSSSKRMVKWQELPEISKMGCHQ